MTRLRYIATAAKIDDDTEAFEVIPNPTVTVYENLTSTPIGQTLYAGPTGGATLPNPFTGDADGTMEFWLETGQWVRIVAAAAGFGTNTLDYEAPIFDPSEVVRTSVANTFSALQTFGPGAYATGPLAPPAAATTPTRMAILAGTTASPYLGTSPLLTMSGIFGGAIPDGTGALIDLEAQRAVYSNDSSASFAVLSGTVRQSQPGDAAGMYWRMIGEVSGSFTTEAVVTANRVGDAITSYTVVSGGLGYKNGAGVIVHGGRGAGGTPARAAATVNVSGVVTAVVPTDVGSGYVGTPDVRVPASPGGWFGDVWSVQIFGESMEGIGRETNVHNETGAPGSPDQQIPGGWLNGAGRAGRFIAASLVHTGFDPATVGLLIDTHHPWDTNLLNDDGSYYHGIDFAAGSIQMTDAVHPANIPGDVLRSVNNGWLTWRSFAVQTGADTLLEPRLAQTIAGMRVNESDDTQINAHTAKDTIFTYGAPGEDGLWTASGQTQAGAWLNPGFVVGPTKGLNATNLLNVDTANGRIGINTPGTAGILIDILKNQNARTLMRIENDNAHTDADALILLQASAGGGDPYTQYSIVGEGDWVVGRDNDVANGPFVIANASFPGTGKELILDGEGMILAQASSPAVPASGFNRRYPLADNRWYELASTGAAQRSAWTSDFATKNRLINGSFALWQRGTSAPTTADNAYAADRWRALTETTATGFTIARETTDVPSGGSRRACKLSIGASNNTKNGLFQPIEGINCWDLRGGVASLQLKLKVSDARIGDVRAAIVQWTGAEDAVSADPISVWGAAATVPTYTGSWANANTPANLGPTTSWATYRIENVAISASATNLAVFVWIDDKTTTAGDYLLVADAQLEEGAFCTDFERLLLTTEELLAMRYFEKSYALDTAPGTGTDVGECLGQASPAIAGSVAGSLLVPNSDVFRVTKRTTPTTTIYASNSGTVNAIRIGGAADRTGVTAGTPSTRKPYSYLAVDNTDADAIGLGAQTQLQWASSAEL